MPDYFLAGSLISITGVIIRIHYLIFVIKLGYGRYSISQPKLSVESLNFSLHLLNSLIGVGLLRHLLITISVSALISESDVVLILWLLF